MVQWRAALGASDLPARPFLPWLLRSGRNRGSWLAWDYTVLAIWDWISHRRYIIIVLYIIISDPVKPHRDGESAGCVPDIPGSPIARRAISASSMVCGSGPWDVKGACEVLRTCLACGIWSTVSIV